MTVSLVFFVHNRKFNSCSSVVVAKLAKRNLFLFTHKLGFRILHPTFNRSDFYKVLSTRNLSEHFKFVGQRSLAHPKAPPEHHLLYIDPLQPQNNSQVRLSNRFCPHDQLAFSLAIRAYDRPCKDILAAEDGTHGSLKLAQLILAFLDYETHRL